MRGVYFIARAGGDGNTQNRYCVVRIMSVLPGARTVTWTRTCHKTQRFQPGKGRGIYEDFPSRARFLCEALLLVSCLAALHSAPGDAAAMVVL